MKQLDVAREAVDDCRAALVEQRCVKRKELVQRVQLCLGVAVGMLAQLRQACAQLEE